MRASISISNALRKAVAYGMTLVTLGATLGSAYAHAADNTPPPGGSGSGTAPADRSIQPEDEDFSSTPYTTYGEFNEDKEEEEDTVFFQYGRFFGVSLGLGMETIDGNRGTLYTGGGAPLIDFKLLYWFDFHFALDLGFFFVNHSYVRSATATPASTVGAHTVNIFQVGVDLKYYFDTKNLSAPISFANPYIMVGAGSYTKSDNDPNLSTSVQDTEIGLNFGGGLEFTLSPRKTFLDFEANIRIVPYNDEYSADYKTPEGLSDLTGNFYTFVAKILFTW